MKNKPCFAAIKMLAVVFGLALLAGCADVQPWERGTLARPEMALETDALDAALIRHTYSSKEAAAGGYGVGGGGCGCN